MDGVSLLFGFASLGATLLLTWISLPRLEKKVVPVVAVVVVCVSQIALMIRQGATNEASERATRDLLTGGDSFAYVVPQSHDPKLSLLIWNHGDHALHGVAVKILDFNLKNKERRDYPEIQIGTIPAHEQRELLPAFLPTPEPDGVAKYWLRISSANGRVEQTLQFRRGNYSLPWAYQYWVTKYGDSRTMKPSELLLKTKGWSDDLVTASPRT